MRKKSVIEDWFPGKLRIKCLALQGQDYRDRVFHGFLAYRGKLGEGATLGEISRATGLSRTSACLLARDSLLQTDLITEDEAGLWHAKEPVKLAKQIREDDEAWVNRYAYQWFLPIRQGSRLTLVDAWIYSTLWSTDKEHRAVTSPQCLAGLAKLAGVHRATVGAAVKKLAGLGLIRIARPKGNRDLFQVGMMKPTPEILDYFQDSTKPRDVLEFLDENGKPLPLYDGNSGITETEEHSQTDLVRKDASVINDDDDDDEPDVIEQCLKEKMLKPAEISTVRKLAKDCAWKALDEFLDLVEILDLKKTKKTCFALLVTDLKRRQKEKQPCI